MSETGAPVFSVRVGYDAHGIGGLVEKARYAEAMGFDQVWTGNDLFGGPGIASLAAMMTATSRIKVGSGVLDPVSIHPVQLAQLASGFQELSGDRFLLGLGAGSDVFFRRAGITPARPVPRTRAAIVAVRALTEGRSPAGLPGAGEGWDEQAGIEAPRPVPVYLGAMGPKMLELAGRHADGALPLCLPPRQVHDAMARIGHGAEAAGRTVGDLDVAACVWCSIDDDRDSARRALARFIARYSGSLSTDTLAAQGFDPEEFARTQALVDEGRIDDATTAVLTSSSMLGLGIVGGAHDVLDQCAELLAAGARHISFGPPLGPDQRHAMRILGEKVLPRLRERPAP
ncbi:LLM class flavin-dependent oxidoreductase [Streptosporangium sp. NPDC051022]|uniref:LLM class flavin-dependent oxidoreductase n=1 Tax=Streptosporangium sp. NPDC051022 TaxID=3155752 RepID=UPI00343FEB76